MVETEAVIAGIEARPMAAAPPVQILTLETRTDFPFEAGQYLEVVHPDGTRIPLSIASPPEQLPLLSLHYRSTPGNPEAERMDELLNGETLCIRGGSGDIRLGRNDARPLLLVAGGTGISQALSLSWAQSLRHPEAAVELLACADVERDMYFDGLLPDTPSFHFVPITDDRRDHDNRALAWLAANASRWHEGTRIVLSGSPAFVYAATDVLVENDIPEKRLESDVYAWAPRGNSA